MHFLLLFSQSISLSGKIPFGIAQIGKAFRNEITPRNFIFRAREFEQMEIEYFISPDDSWQKVTREQPSICFVGNISNISGIQSG